MLAPWFWEAMLPLFDVAAVVRRWIFCTRRRETVDGQVSNLPHSDEHGSSEERRKHGLRTPRCLRRKGRLATCPTQRRQALLSDNQKATLLQSAERKKAFLRRALLAWFRRSARDLPWRRRRDNPYAVWVSEIMLQQTRVEAAAPYFERFMAAFPTVHDLAAAREDRVLRVWQGLGYYSRARNLHRTARRMVRDHGGRFPETAAALERLPGIGRYTAGAIASIAFGERAAVVDGNVRRVLARLLAIDAPVDAPATMRLLWSLAEILLPPRRPGEFNQALMDHGAGICIPRRPRCAVCPVRKACDAFAQGRQNALPLRRPRRAVPHYVVVAACTKRNGRYLLGKRPSQGLLGGLWEFPGGKVEPGETHEQALVREIREELAMAIAVGPLLASVEHTYSHAKVTLHFYRCTAIAGEPQRHHYPEVRWVFPAHFDRYAFPAANRKILPLLKAPINRG